MGVNCLNICDDLFHRLGRLSAHSPKKQDMPPPSSPQSLAKSSLGRAINRLHVPAGSGEETQEWHASIPCCFKSTCSLHIGGHAGSDIFRKPLKTEKSWVLEAAKGCREVKWDRDSQESSDTPTKTRAQGVESGWKHGENAEPLYAGGLEALEHIGRKIP